MLPKAGSIYVKCLAITVVSCGILAAIVSYVGDRASQEIARTAVAAMAKDQTSVAAHQLFGPVRFRKTEDVQGVLATAFGTNDLVRSVVVVDSEGALLATQSIEDAADDPAPLTDLAREAASSAAPVVADDGLTLAFPVTGPGGQSVVGAITASWTTRPFLATIAEYRVTQFTKAALTLIVLLGLGALAIRTLISRPMTRIGARAAAMANGDLHSETPEISSSSEVGDLARSIDALRVKLLSGESARIDARFQSAGFKASSAAMVMCDPELKITYANGAFEELLRENLGFFRSNQADLKAHEIIGTKVDRLLGGAGVTQEKMAMADFPYSEDFPAGERVLGISVLPIRDEDGACEGYVIEWEDTTERRKRDAILAALEEGQLRADFDGAGRMTSASTRFVDATGVSTREISTISLDSLLGADHDEASQKVNNGAPFFGRFALQHGSCRLTLDGSINPIRNRAEEITGFVLLGSDVTEEVARLEEASARNDRMMAAQAHAAAELRSAMAALSKGDLKVRIDSEFEGDYDCVRIDFNAAIAALDTAIGEILAGAHTIRDEVAHVSEAADAFSRRTEQQAATLEETAAAISELTASVESAAQGARRANEVVKQAREDAEASGGVVQETVNAMGEIERSSEQISRIIGVIDEIAFQTNLLALNAGVEAARAGDAGRGFAVVASEVRALAQRSSEAAKEISDLISASGDHVKKGVTLVDKAGSVLTGIARTIGEVADHVSEIASSAREQATGVGEINTAMGQLEQVTQKNVAMFEETMAASQALNDQAGALVDVTGRFECSTIRPKPSSGTFATAPFQTARSEPTKPTAAPTHGSGTAMSSGRADVDSLETSTAERSSPAAVGNLALKSDDEDWEEF